MTGAVVVAGAEPADEGAVLLMQDATEPGTLALPAPEGPFLLKLDDLCLAVEGDGDLGSTQATDPQHRVIFQELAVLPFPFSPSATCSESRNHRGESNLCSRLLDGGLFPCLPNFGASYVPPKREKYPYTTNTTNTYYYTYYLSL